MAVNGPWLISILPSWEPPGYLDVELGDDKDTSLV